MPISRLAPSPTGYLHIGNARSFLLAWLQARALGGEIVLRIDDLDAERAVVGSDIEIVDELRWLGLDWDNTLGPGDYQSNRLDLYREALERLEAMGLLFPCFCSRRELAGAMSAPHGGTPRYPGSCRSLSESVRGDRRLEKSPALRFAIQGKGSVRFTDLIHGERRVDVATETGDFIVARADGVPSYQLAVVVDDIAAGVTHVLRGEDLLDSTARQVLLYETFGERAPIYTHVPLILDEDGRRLAKRHGGISIAEMRREGWASESLVGWLAWSSGLIDTPRAMRPVELIERFDVAALRREPTTLSYAELERYRASGT